VSEEHAGAAEDQGEAAGRLGDPLSDSAYLL
jgi:hypothetical protein